MFCSKAATYECIIITLIVIKHARRCAHLELPCASVADRASVGPCKAWDTAPQGLAELQAEGRGRGGGSSSSRSRSARAARPRTAGAQLVATPAALLP